MPLRSVTPLARSAVFPVPLAAERYALTPGERAAVVEAMWKRFVDTSTIYSGAVEECTRFGYRSGCPVAESIAGRLLTLPNYATLTGVEIDAVADAFLASLNAARSARPIYPAVFFGVRVPAGKV